MKPRGLLCLAVIPLLSSCAATIDYYSYSYTPPGINDPQATISFMTGKAAGAISLRHVGEDGCDMGATRILPRSTSTEIIHAGKTVFFSQSFYARRGNSVCTIEFAFIPRAKGVYKISSEMRGSYCTSKIYEVSDSEQIAVPTKRIVYTKAGLTACRKMHAA